MPNRRALTLRVVLLGAESAALRTLDVITAGGHDLVTILVERPESGGAALARRADRLGVPATTIECVTDPAFAEWIEEREVDILLNAHSLTIIDPDVAAAPRIGSFNLHPGPLPSYAGLNTVTWAIARGEREHAVTLHWIDAGVDTGRIAFSESFPIDENDTALSVFSTCVRLGGRLVDSLLTTAARDPESIPADPQIGPRTLYRRKDIPRDGRVEWDRPARQIHDLARASNFGPFVSPCGHPRAMLGSIPVEIIGTSLTRRACSAEPGAIDRSPSGQPIVATADEWLAVTSVAVDGNRIPASELLEPGSVLTAGV